MYTINIILVLAVVVIAAISIGYLYFSADIFVDVLKQPLKMISLGVFLIDIGVLVVGFLAYNSVTGKDLTINSVPISLAFYIFYAIGSILIILGARKFTRKPMR